jgi:hypothetical protein
LPDGLQNFAANGVSPDLQLLAQRLRQGSQDGSADAPAPVSPDLAALAQALRAGAGGSESDPSAAPALPTATSSVAGQPGSHTPDYGAMADILGKIWNGPNTLLGLGYGGIGTVLGALAGTHPKISIDNNGVQFRNNPLGGVSAITIGNTTTWNGDPFDPNDHNWNHNGHPDMEGNHTFPQHERPHTIQGQELGPLYLPSNVLGGLYSLARTGKWHSDANWNESGPLSDPPAPWGNWRP